MKKKLIFILTLLLTMKTLTTATAQQYVHTKILTGHTNYVDVITFIKNDTLISGGADDTLRAWNVRTGSQRWSKDVGNRVLGAAAPSHNPFFVAYCGFDNNDIRMRYTDDGDWRDGLKGHTKYSRALAFKPRSYILASGSADDTIKIWDVEDINNLRLLRTLRGHTDNIYAVAWSPDGRTLASAGPNGTVRLWNPNNGINYAILRGHRESILTLAFSPNGKLLASGSWDNTTRIWDLDTERTLHVLRANNDVQSITFSPDGKLLASCRGTAIFLWNPTTGKHIATLTGHQKSVVWVVFSPNGTLASASLDNTIRLWEPLTVDVTGNGLVNAYDIREVAHPDNYNKTVASGANPRADVNGDGKVDIKDLIAVAEAVDAQAAAPALVQQHPPLSFTTKEVRQWIDEAKAIGADVYRVGLLQKFLSVATQVVTLPKKTVLLANYPNPFNPETWIPYQLAKPSEVTMSIHAADGKLIRTLALGQLPAGVYQDKSHAVYWDGKNEQGESVASGIYFYTLKAGEFSATKKMLIRK